MLGFLKRRTPKSDDKEGEKMTYSKENSGNEFGNMLNDMNESKIHTHGSVKRFFNKKDSAEYTAVKETLWDVVTRTNDNIRVNADSLNEAHESYTKLLQACDTYINKKGGTTSAGRERKNKVKMIKELALKDMEMIQAYRREIIFMDTQELNDLSWSELLHNAREELLEVADITQYTKLGGNAKTGDKAGRMLNSGVFAPEEVVDHKQVTNDFKVGAFNKKKTAILNEGETLNLSGRNVATSRLAKLLGLGHIIEESATVKIKDKRTNTVKRGNLMSKAKGVVAGSEIDNVKAEVVTKENNTLDKREKAIEAKMTGTVRKELSSLQVFDYLCGQGDRNINNFFLEKDEKGRYTHVHGIDNDMAFGTGVDYEEFVRAEDGITQNKMKMVVSSDNTLTIPHMDKQLAMNIKNLKEEDVRFILEDIIEPKFIDATIERLRKLQEAIQKEEAQSTGIFLEKDKEWDNSHKAFAEKSATRQYQRMLRKKDANHKEFDKMDAMNGLSLEERMEAARSDSYYGEMVERMMGRTGIAYERRYEAS